MSTLSVHLFGQFGVRRDEQIVSGLAAHRVQELFSYLLLYRDHPHPREALASLLWGDSSTIQSKTYLRKALWQLQTALDSRDNPTNSHVLLVEPDWVQLNSKADLWCDVAIFEQVFARVQGRPGTELDIQCAQDLRIAVDLYDGDLLEGWYQDWCLYERERLQQLYLAMLDKLTGYCEAHHECENGLVYGTRILRYEPARECTHQRLMRLHYLAGDRTAALRQYDRCVAALNQELGVKPDEDTVALYEQIRTNQRVSSSQPQPNASPALVAAPAPLHEILGRLKRFHTVLSDVQCQIQQDIQAVERVLSSRH
jgi:DNA-binding SARP family transcriptional activator